MNGVSLVKSHHSKTKNSSEIFTLSAAMDSCSNALSVKTNEFQSSEAGELISLNDGTSEVKYLREMSLLNLDVIHKQYELIQSKDKQIKSLKTEREALKCRLERMERRMSLLRQHQDVQEKITKQISPPTAQPPSSQERGKRKSTFEPENLSKKFASSVTRERHDSSGSTRSTRSNQSKQCSSADVPKNNRSKVLTPARQPSAKPSVQDEVVTTPQHNKSWIRHLSPEEKNSNCNSRTVYNKSEDADNNVLRTDYSYYSPNQYRKPELRSKKNVKEKVEVPTWKIITFTNCYTLEGTENLEDEIFIKRHQKPEKEEVRRKRWDMQRLREQRMYEKLQQGRYASKLKKQIREEDREPETFIPKLDDAQYIEVCEQIPVTAFGYPIPSIDKSEFGLPWCEKSNKTSKSTPRKR